MQGLLLPELQKVMHGLQDRWCSVRACGVWLSEVC